jgi:hypothetical protein
MPMRNPLRRAWNWQTNSLWVWVPLWAFAVLMAFALFN